MNISARVEYACLAVMQLAAQYEADEPICLRTIADTHGIPARFLVQILLQLKAAGLVASTRGAAGGYRLAKSPATISLADVMRVIEGQLSKATRSSSHETAQSRALFHVWKEISQLQCEILEQTTFQDLTDRAAKSAGHMYYI